MFSLFSRTLFGCVGGGVACAVLGKNMEDSSTLVLTGVAIGGGYMLICGGKFWTWFTSRPAKDD